MYKSLTRTTHLSTCSIISRKHLSQAVSVPYGWMIWKLSSKHTEHRPMFESSNAVTFTKQIYKKKLRDEISNPQHLRRWFFSFRIFLRFSCAFMKRTWWWISSNRFSLFPSGSRIAADIISSVSSHAWSSDNSKFSNRSSKFVEKILANALSAANEKY